MQSLKELDPDDGVYVALLVQHMNLPEEFLNQQEAKSAQLIQRLKNLNLLQDGISAKTLVDAWHNFGNDARWPLPRKQKVLNKFAKK